MTAMLMQKALQLHQAGRLSEAAAIYAQILGREPQHFEALHALGILRFQSGRLEDAERLIRSAIAMRPDAADAVYNRACLLMRMNRTEDALAGFETAIALNPGYAEAHMNRGSLLAQLGRHGDALTSFDSVAALRPDMAEAWSHRAAALYELGRFGEAISNCDRALALEPGQAFAEDIRARALAERPSLPEFERQVAERRFQAALESALRILDAIDATLGRLDRLETGEPFAGSNDAASAKAFATRFAPALARLLSDPELVLPFALYEGLVVHHRWIDLIFSLTEAGTSDAMLPVDLRRRLALRSLNSSTDIDFESVWRADAQAAAPAFLHYLASRCVFDTGAFALRERLLEWLPERLSEVALPPLTLAHSADALMHCSYAFTSGKHAIKRAIMRQLRQACLDSGCREIAGDDMAAGDRPTIVVVAEHLNPGHSVYRTHRHAIASLKDRFHVIGAVYPDPRGTEIEALFDECLPLSGPDFFPAVADLAARIRALKPALIFYTGVGMVPCFVALASLRLAPIQCASFGHTATTMSDAIDYFILPEEFIGSPDVFSEKLIALPKAAMPIAPREVHKHARPHRDDIVRVAVPGSIMKLNPKFFDTIAEIASRVCVRIEIQFFPAGAHGLAYAALAKAACNRVPQAVVFPEMPQEAYMEHLNRCDLFLSPFPYGNMNSLIDAFQLGLPGVCLDGPEPHAHADRAFFARVGLPDELCAQTMEGYMRTAVKLIDDSPWRDHCRTIVAQADLGAAFFNGEPDLFCEAIADLIAHRDRVRTGH